MKEVKIKMVKDQVCGMNVDEKTAKFKSEYKGRSARCRSLSSC